jgi:hypothetical protein
MRRLRLISQGLHYRSRPDNDGFESFNIRKAFICEHLIFDLPASEGGDAIDLRGYPAS